MTIRGFLSGLLGRPETSPPALPAPIDADVAVVTEDGFVVVMDDTASDETAVAEFLGDPGAVFERESEPNEPPLSGSLEDRFRRRSTW